MLAMVKKIKTKDNRTNIYIHLRRSRDCLLLWLFGCVCVCACVRACVCVGLRVGYALHLLILDSCYAHAHKRIVNRIKVYIEGSNMQVELV